VTLAIYLSAKSHNDEYKWYFVTIFFDTTIGVFVCYFFLRSLDKLFEKQGWVACRSGNYFNVLTPEEQIIELDRKKNHFSSKKEMATNLLKPIIKINICTWAG